MLRVVEAGAEHRDFRRHRSKPVAACGHANRRRVDNGANPAHVCAEIARAVATEAGDDRPGFALEQIQDVRQTILKAAIDEHLGFGDRRKRGGDRHQVTEKVAAVDRGDVERRQRNERLGVVPVEEMSAIPRKLVQAVDGAIEPRQALGCREVSEIPGRHRRHHLQADVGGRRAVRDRVWPVLLIVIGDQPVIARGDDRLEKAPRQLARCGAVRGDHVRRAPAGRLASAGRCDRRSTVRWPTASAPAAPTTHSTAATQSR